MPKLSKIALTLGRCFSLFRKTIEHWTIGTLFLLLGSWLLPLHPYAYLRAENRTLGT